MCCYESTAESVIPSTSDELEINQLQTIRAIVFESPGTISMLTDKQKRWANGKNSNYEPNVISYLSAPNFINTIHQHAGKIIRLSPPHIPKDFISNAVEFFSSYTESATRLYIILTAIDTSINKKINRDLLDGIVAFGILSILSRGVMSGALWTYHQHKMENLLSCFNSQTGQINNIPGKDNGKVMNSWPNFRQYQTDRLRRIGFFASPIPLPYLPFSNTGITNFFRRNTNEVIEEQIRNTRGYQ